MYISYIVSIKCYRRCPPLFEVLLHVLAAYLAASRVWLSEHAHTQKCVSLAMKDPNTAAIQEKEELRDVIIATQESAVVQLLLEICLPTEEDEVRCYKNNVAIFTSYFSPLPNMDLT